MYIESDFKNHEKKICKFEKIETRMDFVFEFQRINGFLTIILINKNLASISRELK